MSDLEAILLIVAALYVVECGHWVRPGSLVFVSHWGLGRRRHALRTGALLHNDHGGVLFGNFLPVGDSAISQAWPLSFSPDGVLAYVALAATTSSRPEQSGEFIRFDDLRAATTDGRTLLLNGKPFLTVSTSALANYLAATLQRLAALPAAERGAAIDEVLAKSLDAEEAEKALNSARAETIPLLLTCLALFGYLFVYLTYCALRDVPLDFLRAMLLYAALLGFVVINYGAAVRMLLPGDKKAANHFWMMFLSPADALHARDVLLRAVLSKYQPLAVARVLCPAATVHDLARQTLLDLRNPFQPIGPFEEETARAAEAWFRGRQEQALLTFLQKVGLSAAELTRPPSPEGVDCVAYCPRCLGQYLRDAGECNGCTGVALVKFGAVAPPLPLLSPPAPVLPPRSATAAAPARPRSTRRGRRKRR